MNRDATTKGLNSILFIWKKKSEDLILRPSTPSYHLEHAKPWLAQMKNYRWWTKIKLIFCATVEWNRNEHSHWRNTLGLEACLHTHSDLPSSELSKLNTSLIYPKKQVGEHSRTCAKTVGSREGTQVLSHLLLLVTWALLQSANLVVRDKKPEALRLG